MRDIFISRLSEIASRDPKVLLITGDLGFGVLTEFERRFPRQFLNVGVAEQNMTGIATGLALEGRTVFTYSIANFPTLRCLEQIRNDACYHNANVKIVAIGGGFSYGQLGMSHHATEDLAILRAIPGMTVVSPGDDWETAEATSAIVVQPGCCYLRLDKSSAGNLHRQGERFTIGRARTVREGTDVTIMVTGGILGVVMKTAEALSVDGIETRVTSMHSIQPFDSAAVMEAAQQTGGIVTVEEHVLNGGLGSAVAEACMDAGISPLFFRRIALRDGFASRVGDQQYLRSAYGLGQETICSVVKDLVKSRQTSTSYR